MSGQTHNKDGLSLFLFKYGAMDKVKFWMISVTFLPLFPVQRAPGR
jgi:hypothetical protein